MAVQESRITVHGGVVGPLSTIELQRLLFLLKRTDIAEKDTDRKMIDRFAAFLEHKIEEETTIGLK